MPHKNGRQSSVAVRPDLSDPPFMLPLTWEPSRSQIATMSNRQAKHRSARIAAGARPVYLLLSAEAYSELQQRCVETGMSRVKLVEMWLTNDLSPHE